MIEGRVAAIINERELAINRGANDGVETGMRFIVLERSPVKVIDPDTEVELGQITGEKVRVRIVRVDSNYSVARTSEGTVGRPGILGNYFDMFGSGPSPRTLRKEDAKYEPITEADSYVKVGDPVRQVEE